MYMPMFNRQVDNVVIISIQDHEAPCDARQVTQRLMNFAETGRFWYILDLSATEILRLSLIGAILQLNRHASRNGGGVLLVNPSQRNKNMMLITRLSELASVYTSIPEAIATLKEKEKKCA